MTDIEIGAVLDEQPPRALQMTGYAVSIMILALVTIAAVAEVDAIVEGRGELAMDAPPIVLQPMERSIIRSILVKSGEAVKMGQVLATLDPTFAQADVDALSAQHKALEAQMLRLDAEINDKPFELTASSNTNEAMQAAIFRQRQHQYNSRVRGFEAKIAKAEDIIASVSKEQGILDEQLTIAQAVERMRKDLMHLEYSSKLHLFESQNARLRAEQVRRDATSRQQQAEHDATSAKAELKGFIDEWRRQTLEELERTRTEYARLNEAMSKAKRMRQLVEVTSPQDAVVLEVANRSIGSVLREAEPLVTLVPSSGKMIADVLIKSSDVGYVKPGDSVTIKVDAFPYQRHGVLTGKLRSVSESSFSPYSHPGAEAGPGRAANPAAGGSMHRARIELSEGGLGHLPAGGRLIPGMTVDTEIKIGSRNVLTYFFDPFRRGFEQSLREP